MNDGRKHQPARATITVALTLGLTGAGIVAATPASAAPDDLSARIDQAREKAERLAGPAQARQQQHDRARERASSTGDRVQRLSGRIAEARELGTGLRNQMAREVMVENGSAAGAAAPTVDLEMQRESTQLLANVMVVTEDTDGRAQQLSSAMLTVEQLRDRRAQAREALREQRQVVDRTGRQAETAAAALGSAESREADLEAELEAQQAEQEAQQAEVASSSAVDYAMAQVGKSYVWGASGPDSFDCSGLTSAAWATEGVTLPRTSSAQYSAGTPVSESELQPGDLVFYYSPISHVGMYVGDGQVVNALNPGSGVQVTGLHDMPYSGAVRPG